MLTSPLIFVGFILIINLSSCLASDCPKGLYGNCKLCGKCLNSEPCNQKDGTCPRGCDPGFGGPLCQGPCAHGRYGRNCAERCGHCKGKVWCDPENGNCSGKCEVGWSGPNCKIPPPLTTSVQKRSTVHVTNQPSHRFPSYSWGYHGNRTQISFNSAQYSDPSRFTCMAFTFLTSLMTIVLAKYLKPTSELFRTYFLPTTETKIPLCATASDILDDLNLYILWLCELK